MEGKKVKDNPLVRDAERRRKLYDALKSVDFTDDALKSATSVDLTDLVPKVKELNEVRRYIDGDITPQDILLCTTAVFIYCLSLLFGA